MSRHPSPATLREAGSLPPDQRTELLRHVRDCAPCRAILATDDPTRLFALLAAEPVPIEHLERLSGRVEAALRDAPRHGQGLGPRAAGAIAASILLAAFLGSLFWPGAEAPAPVPPRAEPAEVAGEPGRAGEVELYLPDEAEVVNFSIGETQLVMIFNEGLEL